MKTKISLSFIKGMKFCRYLELVYPIWHRTHFKIRYIYMAIAFVWVFGIGLNAAYMIPTGKVGSENIANLSHDGRKLSDSNVKSVF